jgi:hypothetical protein
MGAEQRGSGAREWAQILLSKLDSPYPPLSYCKRGLSRSFYRMVAACLDRDPDKRCAHPPPAVAAVNHRWH